MNGLGYLPIEKGILFAQEKLSRYLSPLVSIDNTLMKISQTPIHLGFEVANICNARCIFCGYPHMERPKAILPMEVFKKTIDEFDAFGGGSIGFNPVAGDPLIDPYIIERIRYARNKRNIGRIGLFTNGILISQIGAKTLIESEMDDITISIGGFDPESYYRIFRVNHWDSVYQGILSLLRENALSNKKVHISIALRSDMPIWKSLNTPSYRELRKYPFDLQFNLRHFVDSWSGRIRQEHLTGTMRLRKSPQKKEPCSILYRVPKILSNGDMTLCGCRDLNGDSELVLGNVEEKTILEMWRDPRVEKIRNGFYLSKYPKICLDCSMYEDLSFFRREKIRALLRERRERRGRSSI
jgi:MoaA/NifB/PqqE/SkfB family radical SAM enzyme